MSSSNIQLTVKCPTCKCAVIWSHESKFKPFCSDRCRLIDLGEWIMEEKRIPGESLELDINEEDDFFYQ
jgi:Uncharacterized protein conserved in bacteria